MFLISTDLSAQWTTAKLSLSRSRISSSTVGTKVIFAGGTDIPNQTLHGVGNIDIYDFANNTWSSPANPGYGIGASAANAVVNQYVVFAGSQSQCNGATIYNSSSASWAASTMSTARFLAAGGGLGSKAYFGGGTKNGGIALNSVDILDLNSGNWTSANISVARHTLRCATVGNKIIFAGGYTQSSSISNVVDIFDSSTGVWTTAALSLARINFSVAVLGTKVYFGGGQSIFGYSGVVDIYDSQTNTWTTTTLPTPRAYMGAAAAGSKVFFAGGADSSGAPSKVVDIFDVNSLTWTTDQLSIARGYVAGASVGNKVFFAGGETNGITTSDVVDIYTMPKQNQTITFNALQTKSGGDAPFQLTATTSSGLPINYTSSNISVATISGNTVTITGVGATTITAKQAGDANYNAATDVSQTLTVVASKQNQTITFNALPTKALDDAPFQLTATASSGLPVSYSSSNNAVATIAGSTVTIVGAGTTTITASQIGDNVYNAASPISKDMIVSSLSPPQGNYHLAQIGYAENQNIYAYNARSAYINGNYLYVLFSKSNVTRILTFDITDPTRPTKLDSLILTEREGEYLLGDGMTLYVSGYISNHLSIFDLSNPVKPQLTSTVKKILTSNGTSYNVQSRYLGKIGSTLYLTGGFAGVLGVNVSSPSAFQGLRSTIGSGFAGVVQVGSDIVIFDDYRAYYSLGSALTKNGEVDILGDPSHAMLYSDNKTVIVYSTAIGKAYIHLLDVASRTIIKTFDITKDVGAGFNKYISIVGGTILAVKGTAAFATYDISSWATGDFTQLPLISIIKNRLSGGDCLYSKNELLIVGDGGSIKIFRKTLDLPIPTANAATAITDKGFTANWSAVSGVTGYQLDVSLDDFKTFELNYNSKAVTGTSAIVTGLQPNSVYKYRVRSANGDDPSANSNVITLKTLVTSPVANSASSITQTGFTANWRTVSNASGYQLDVSQDNFATFISGYNSKSLTTTSEVVTGLVPGTQYKYRVRVLIGSDGSGNSNAITVTTTPAIDAPVATTATAITGNSFTANWNALAAATGYQLDVSADNFTTFVVGYNSKSVTSNIQAVAGLQGATAYKYRVRAINAIGSSLNSNTIDVTTLAPPPAPAAASATTITGSAFVASWAAVASATSYQLDVSGDNFTTFVIGYNSKVVTGLMETVTGLNAGTAYKYRVRAVNANGVSANSNVIDATTLPPPIAPVAATATSITGGGFIANWNSVSGVTGYQLDISSDGFTTFLTGYNSNSITSTSENVTDLTASTAYKYRVRAVNANGISVNSNVIEVTTLAKQNQTITFAALADKTLGDAAFALTATASSTLPVTYSTTSDKLTISGGQVTLVKAGRASIVANQAGNDAFNAATAVTQSFCIKPAKPAITLSNNNTETVTLNSSATTGNQWYFAGTAIAGATNATLAITTPGVYKVQVKVEDCTSDFSADQTIIVTGDIKLDGSVVSISPNPVDGNIQINGIVGEIKSNLLFDMTGRASSTLTLEKKDAVYQASVTHLNQGVYLLRILQENRVIQLKFVKK